MATRFELVMHGRNPVMLRAAGEEAVREIERLHAQLSLYAPGSEIFRINTRAAMEPVRVEPGLFQLLQRAQALSADTRGAFDITVAPLVRAWGFMGGSGAKPDGQAIAEARACVGMRWVELNERDVSIRFARPGVMLDLGAIGKGFALERATEILREAGVASALLHGGTSTICTIGCPPDAPAWPVAIERPPNHLPQHGPAEAGHPASSRPLAVIPLVDEALSVSAIWGKHFSAGEQTFGHVIDPRTGRPVQNALLAAVATNSATDSDALSTALLTLGAAGQEMITRLRPGLKTWLVTPDEYSNDSTLRVI